MPFDSIDEIKAYLPIARKAFEVNVERVAADITVEATKLSSALGEVSIDDLMEAIIKEFARRLRESCA